MSSGAYILRAGDEEPIAREEWLSFCAEEGIVFSPNTVGQNVFYQGDVEVTFGDMQGPESVPQRPDGRPDWSQAEPPAAAHRVTVATYHMGGSLPETARLALKVWARFGGSLEAAEELRELLAPTDEPVEDEPVPLDASGPRKRPSGLAERL